MVDRLTDEDVNEIFNAFDCDESGSEHLTLRQKLYRMFPAVKQMHEEREAAWKAEAKRQTDNRRTITIDVLDSIDFKQKLLPQIATWVTDPKKWIALRSYNSDEICLAGDIWRYFNSEIKARISEELGERYSAKTWHYLARYLDTQQSKARRQRA